MHGVVLAEIHKLRHLVIRERNVAIKPFYLSDEMLKLILKHLDFDYPRQKDGTPLSYTKLREADFLSHIAFLETVMAENGYEPKYLERMNNENQSGI